MKGETGIDPDSRRHLVMDLEPDDRDRPVGTIAPAGAGRTGEIRFSGWLELIEAIDRVRHP